MARSRLRDKLMLGLALVAGSIGALAAGTTYGFYSFYISTKSTTKKLEELTIVTEMIQVLDSTEQKNDPKEHLALIAESRHVLDKFRFVNQKTVESGFDPDDGEQEKGYISDLDKHLSDLTEAVNRYNRVPRTQAEYTVSLRNTEPVREAHGKARQAAEGLRFVLLEDIQATGRNSGVAIRKSIWWAGFFLVWALSLVATMLYYFRVWMFAPIRELQAGVQRVHGGNFSQPIGLKSGDELQELSDEFDALISRLHTVYADLARQVNERSRQLVRSERMVSVGFLAAGVAHEINNPLASILFCSEALERRLQEVLSAVATTATGAPTAEAEVLTRYLKMIQQEALRCKDITQKLLDFSRTGDRRKESTDLTSLVRGVLEVARHLPSSRGKTVAFEPSGYIVAPVNSQDLKSVILNLVVNALDSMEEDGRLAITLTSGGGYAELVFADTGCGMSPDVLQNIFEPFFTKSRTGKGTGLGLFISHQIVDQHGGTITATSSGPGTGSTFTVRIPLELAPGAQQPQSEGDTDPAPTLLKFPGSREAA